MYIKEKIIITVFFLCVFAGNVRSQNCFAVFTVSKHKVCLNQPVTITNQSYGGMMPRVYDWNFGPGASPPNFNGQFPPNVVYNTPGKKIIQLTYTANSGLCVDIAVDSVFVLQPPITSISFSQPMCVGEGVDFYNTGTTGPNWGYFWNFGPDAIPSTSNAENPKGIVYTSGGNKMVSFTISDSICMHNSNFPVNIFFPPLAEAGNNAAICPNTSIRIGSIPLPGRTYSWSPVNTLDNPNVPDPLATPDAPETMYFLTVTDINNGCKSVDSVKITLLPPPVVFAGNDTSISKGSSVQMNASGGINYFWSPSEGLDNAYIFNPFASPEITTTYIVKVTDAYGCINTDDVVVTVVELSIWVPQAFTPDGNGFNDEFIVRGGEGVGNFELAVFSSWGEMVYYTKNINEGWNGRKQNTGEELIEDAYIYCIKGKNVGIPFTINGLVNLIR
ncbi:MAG: gliding motility-associated C-terminal domain-containing protein [Bacteroidales bacterium]|nr:gliding motility-associated C-terminal domain-containing protein [Bacteroidales bacterium]